MAHLPTSIGTYSFISLHVLECILISTSEYMVAYPSLQFLLCDSYVAYYCCRDLFSSSDGLKDALNGNADKPKYRVEATEHGT